MNRPMIIAHRGTSGEAPENTMAAFRLAVEQGCDGIELDVHLTKDEQIVVCHDATLERTTSGTGRISDYTFAELEKLDAGSWFSEKFTGEKIPLLEQVLKEVPEHVMINIEVKDFESASLAKKLVELLQSHHTYERFVVSAFNHQWLYNLKQMDENILIGLLYSEKLVNHAKLVETFTLPVYSLHPNFRAITAENVKQASENGLQMYPFTINEVNDLKRMIEYNVQGIITDYPARLKQLL